MTTVPKIGIYFCLPRHILPHIGIKYAAYDIFSLKQASLLSQTDTLNANTNNALNYFASHNCDVTSDVFGFFSENALGPKNSRIRVNGIHLMPVFILRTIKSPAIKTVDKHDL